MKGFSVYFAGLIIGAFSGFTLTATYNSLQQKPVLANYVQTQIAAEQYICTKSISMKEEKEIESGR